MGIKGVTTEYAVRNRICCFCEKTMKKGTECARFPHATRSICIPCFKESCVRILGEDAFSTHFKASIMAEKV